MNLWPLRRWVFVIGERCVSFCELRVTLSLEGSKRATSQGEWKRAGPTASARSYFVV